MLTFALCHDLVQQIFRMPAFFVWAVTVFVHVWEEVLGIDTSASIDIVSRVYQYSAYEPVEYVVAYLSLSETKVKPMIRPT